MKGLISGSDNVANFYSDLQEAHSIENGLAKWFENRFDCIATTSQDKGSFPDWDVSIYFPSHDKTVKFENKCRRFY